MRYRPILVKKINNEQKLKKSRLRKMFPFINTIEDVLDRYRVLGIIFSVVKTAAYVAFIGLIFLGIITLFNPASRAIIFGWFGLA